MAQKKRASIVTLSRPNPDPPLYPPVLRSRHPAHAPGDAAFIGYAGNIRIT